MPKESMFMRLSLVFLYWVAIEPVLFNSLKE